MLRRRFVCMCGLPLAAPVFARAEPQIDFDKVLQAANALPRLRSLFVSCRGELLFEHYFHGARATRHANIKSVAKSVISALTGIAIDRQILPGVDTPITKYFPELAGSGTDSRKRTITIEHLLTMRSGLESTSGRNYGAWVRSRNWVRYVLGRPLISAPGERMEYSTGNTHLLSAILTKAAEKSTWAFAQEVLAKPLGFDLPRWTRDPQGIYFGGNEMLMTPRQMLRFGQLYAHSGVLNGNRILPEAWIRESFMPRGRSPISDQLYGYGWWISVMAGQPVHFAWGAGGQYIFLIPSSDLIVVATSTLDGTAGQRRQHHSVYDLVEDVILRPLSR